MLSGMNQPVVKTAGRSLGVVRDFLAPAVIADAGRDARKGAGHGRPSPRTAMLYDRTGDEITLDEVERITI
jgi:hypothetical protein